MSNLYDLLKGQDNTDIFLNNIINKIVEGLQLYYKNSSGYYELIEIEDARTSYIYKNLLYYNHDNIINVITDIKESRDKIDLTLNLLFDTGIVIDSTDPIAYDYLELLMALTNNKIYRYIKKEIKYMLNEMLLIDKYLIIFKDINTYSKRFKARQSQWTSFISDEETINWVVKIDLELINEKKYRPFGKEYEKIKKYTKVGK